MKNIFIFISLFFIFSAQGQHVSLMTYNIRLDVVSDGKNAWLNRKDFLVGQIKFYEPDILGTQEGLPHQISYMNEQLPEYKLIGEGRDGGDKGEYSGIFYNKEKFKLISNNTFCLSDAPDTVSMGWDAACRRVCTYGLFEDKKSKKRFWVFNTHLDHMGQQARDKGIELILGYIDKLNKKGYPAILMGDFNATPKSDLIENLKTKMTDTHEVSLNGTFGPNETFNGFKFTKVPKVRIDYIFISKKSRVEVLKHAVLTDSKNLKYPSDHFPVYVELKFK